jgi:hypothetical protein
MNDMVRNSLLNYYRERIQWAESRIELNMRKNDSLMDVFIVLRNRYAEEYQKLL